MTITVDPLANLTVNVYQVNPTQEVIECSAGGNCSGSARVHFDKNYVLQQVTGQCYNATTQKTLHFLLINNSTYAYAEGYVNHNAAVDRKFFFHKFDDLRFTSDSDLRMNFTIDAGSIMTLSYLFEISDEKGEVIKKCDLLDWILGRC